MTLGRSLLRPVMWLAAAGLAASLVVHVLGLLGISSPLGGPTWLLHLGVFVVWIPVVIVSQPLTRGQDRRDHWRILLRNCPLVDACYGLRLLRVRICQLRADLSRAVSCRFGGRSWPIGRDASQCLSWPLGSLDGVLLHGIGRLLLRVARNRAPLPCRSSGQPGRRPLPDMRPTELCCPLLDAAGVHVTTRVTRQGHHWLSIDLGTDVTICTHTTLLKQ
jgi:hypothetical protein